MPPSPEDIAYCHACGSPMNVAALAPFSNAECPECGKHTRVKREFGPYTLVRRHAAGGMSMVFVAQDNTLDREVALKILSEDYSADEKRIAAFEEEARITASFSHPHVVRVLRTGKAFGRFYIAMEFVPGGHFEHQIRVRGKIPEAEMLPLAIEVAQGLKAAHAAGLIHRDVKPGNILLDSEGHAKLVDFGLALVTKGGKAKATEVWATPYYVPPETIEGFPEDLRSDIYAFGATLYHALAGVPPCGEESMATDILREAKKRVIPLGIAEPSLSSGVCEIVEKAMAYDPNDRFSTYDELISRLESALKRLQSGAAGAVESSGTVAKRRARHRTTERISLVGYGLILLIAVVGGLWWVIRDEPAGNQPAPPIVDSPRPDAPETVPDAVIASGISKEYSAARAAVKAHDFSSAAVGFARLRDNPAVQEPTRSWAGVEAVAAAYLDGRGDEARTQAKSCADHARAVPTDKGLAEPLLVALEKLPELPGISAKDLQSGVVDAPHVMAWLLIGLKDWDQGMLDDAASYFHAVTEAKIPPDDAWLATYQDLARDYLADREALGAEVFAALPTEGDLCQDAIRELEKIHQSLKTRGRAPFNVRAWQLDLLKHYKLLTTAPDPAKTNSSWEFVSNLAKAYELVKACRFTDASVELNTLTSDPPGTKRSSLIALTDASAAFLDEMTKDLEKQAATGEFALASGTVVREVAAAPDGSLLVTAAEGSPQLGKWADFAPDSLISLHRTLLKNPVLTEADRLRRNEHAICYDWLVGNRERARSAAALLSDGSPAFKKRWDTIASGLPE